MASPKRFIEWAIFSGYAPGLAIHRVDNDGNYEPSNCTWVSPSEHSKMPRVIRKEREKADPIKPPTRICQERPPDIFDMHQTPKWLVDYPTGYDPRTGLKINAASQDGSP